MAIYNKVRKAVFEAMGMEDNGEDVGVTFHAKMGIKEGERFFKKISSKEDSCSHKDSYLVLRCNKKDSCLNSLVIFTETGRE